MNVSFFYIFTRHDLKCTSDSCETLSPDQLPSSTAFVCLCIHTGVCALYVLYDSACLSCVFAGGGIHYESLKEGDPWNVEVKNSLSGGVKASPLICPYPPQET